MRSARAKCLREDKAAAAAVPARRVARSMSGLSSMMGNQRLQRLLRAELGAGPRKLRPPVRPAVVQRQPAQPSNLNRLDEMLNRSDVPEEAVIALLGRLSATEKTAVLSGGYQRRIASALDVGEMVRAVNNLGPPLDVKLGWVESATSKRSSIDYSDIRGMITAAPATQRLALNNARWRGFFVDVCSDATMIQAVRDLGFQLPTQLEWIEAEASLSDVDYADIRGLVLAAPQTQRDALKTNRWRTFFVEVCTDATMIQAVRDLAFDLTTKLEWIEAEASPSDLGYSEIKGLVTAAPQTQRNALKTPHWRDFFVGVCTNATMAEAVDDLRFDLATKLLWMATEGTSYAALKSRIVPAPAAEKTTALGTVPMLREVQDDQSRNDFAKVVELLGRSAPTAATLLGDPTVTAAMAAAFTASSAAVTLPPHNPANPVGPCNPPAGTPAPAGVHEEGGWVYLNLITGALTTRRASAGAQASISLGSPPNVADSVLVAAFHTHPNVGPCWTSAASPVFASGADTRLATERGAPDLIMGAFPTPATTVTTSTGPAQRLHLAGDRGFPGSSGGDAPQATLDGTYDEV